MNKLDLDKPGQSEHSPASPVFLLIFSFLVALVLGMVVFVVVTRILRSSGILRQPQILTARLMTPLGTSLEICKSHFDNYPTSLQEMRDNIDTLSNEAPEYLRRYSYSTNPIDGWGNEFSYTSDGTSWKLTSFGADGQPGGEGINADVYCTDQRYYWGRRVMMQKCFQDAFPTYLQTIRAEWKSIGFWVLFTIATTWPMIVGYCFLSRRKRRCVYMKDAFRGLGCVTLIVAVMWFLAVVLYYCLPGD